MAHHSATPPAVLNAPVSKPTYTKVHVTNRALKRAQTRPPGRLFVTRSPRAYRTAAQ